MKKVFFTALIIGFVNLNFTAQTQAQSLELIGGNVLNGALTGSALSLAVMGLQNESSFRAYQIGLGAGLLGGTGIAIYDVATIPQGHHFFISGIFNDGNNSSIIILLDTAYGAVLGAAVGTAVILIGNKSFVKGVQYGASTGAWVGFGVGLVDSFFIAERNSDFVASAWAEKSSLMSLSFENQLKIDLLQPGLISTYQTGQDFLSYEINPVLNLVSLKKRF